MKQTTITCNECSLVKGSEQDRNQRDAWLTLLNPDLISSINDKVRLDSDHHFCGLVCLDQWSSRAKDDATVLVKTTSGISPRGSFVNESSGLHY